MPRSSRPLGPDPHAVPAWVRVIPSGAGFPLLERLVELTPYMVETILEDARAPGRVRRLEVILGPTEPERVVVEVQRLFAPARAAGLMVEILRSASPAGPPLAAPRPRRAGPRRDR